MQREPSTVEWMQCHRFPVVCNEKIVPYDCYEIERHTHGRCGSVNPSIMVEISKHKHPTHRADRQYVKAGKYRRLYGATQQPEITSFRKEIRVQANFNEGVLVPVEIRVATPQNVETLWSSDISTRRRNHPCARYDGFGDKGKTWN